MLTDKTITKSCISDITSFLSDVIETRDTMITISIRKHLNEKLRPVFAMLHKLQGVLDQTFVPKQGGGGGSTVMTRKEGPKAPTKLVVKQEPKGKENCLKMSPSLTIVKMKRSDMKMSSKDERFAMPNWIRTTESSVRLMKNKGLIKKLRPHFREESFYFPSGP